MSSVRDARRSPSGAQRACPIHRVPTPITALHEVGTCTQPRGIQMRSLWLTRCQAAAATLIAFLAQDNNSSVFSKSSSGAE